MAITLFRPRKKGRYIEACANLLDFPLPVVKVYWASFWANNLRDSQRLALFRRIENVRHNLPLPSSSTTPHPTPSLDELQTFGTMRRESTMVLYSYLSTLAPRNSEGFLLYQNGSLVIHYWKINTQPEKDMSNWLIWNRTSNCKTNQRKHLAKIDANSGVGGLLQHVFMHNLRVIQPGPRKLGDVQRLLYRT